jgi:hypothetical protein
MKLFFLLLVSTVLMATACKKNEKVTPIPPPPPTKDFRENYIGTFNVTKIGWSISNPGGKPPTRTSQVYTGTVQVSYKISDSIHNLSAGYPGYMQAALVFTYGNGIAQTMGIDTLGKLCYPPNPNSGDYGGFITTDSIFHAHGNRHTTSSSEDTLKGKRIK